MEWKRLQLLTRVIVVYCTYQITGQSSKVANGGVKLRSSMYRKISTSLDSITEYVQMYLRRTSETDLIMPSWFDPVALSPGISEISVHLLIMQNELTGILG